MVELADLIDGVANAWSMTDENIARLVDRDDYYLRSKYSQWTHDPDDEGQQALRAKRERDGIKPPPEPIIQPAALRPPPVHDLYMKHYKQQLEDYETNPPLKGVIPAAAKGRISDLRK